METNENKNTVIQKYVGCRKSGSKNEVHSNTDLHSETRIISNKKSKLTNNGAGKIITKSKVSRERNIIKISAEINKKE